MPLRPGLVPVLTIAARQPGGCRSYSPLEGCPVTAGHASFSTTPGPRQRGSGSASFTNREASIHDLFRAFRFREPIRHNVRIFKMGMANHTVFTGQLPGETHMHDKESHGKPVEQLVTDFRTHLELSLIHISEPTRRTPISYAVFC